MEPHRLKPGDQLPLAQSKGQRYTTVTVVGFRMIENIDCGSYMISMRDGSLVQHDGWSDSDRCFVIDLEPGRGDYGCAWPGEEYVLVTLS